MGSEVSPAASFNGNVEVFPWLKTLPVAPEYHPTLAEFQDPIAYIFKIEKEASQFGICKIVPPVPPNPKKTAISNLNKSLLARSGSDRPTFTTRQQQIGFCPRKHRPVQKPVWQSGENYTVPEFEAKAKGFEKNYLKRCAKKSLTPLEVETLYWKATVDKPFSVEYANDMPGSAFALKRGGKVRSNGNGSGTVGETEWNMRGVSRAKGSLLKFMKEEIPGVTSPMLYIAMMFSWFAWHVEDHDLHSLNYLHMGAGKTWYGVPRDAAVAFEEVIRVHGYGGEVNPLVTFATLGEKTTVMSPEVLVDAGVPCCRLVQNAGEFVVTFPRAYHSGFSHGFNCGEASNIATPEWLRVAKDAAIRRASINSPPMVSHFQLLYDLALSFTLSISKTTCLEQRSSRLKNKKGEGEILVKKVFAEDVIQSNCLLHMLADCSPVVILSRNSLGSSIYSNSRGGKLPAESRLSYSFCSPDLTVNTTNSVASVDLSPPRKQGILEGVGGCMEGDFTSISIGEKHLNLGSASDAFGLASLFKNIGIEPERASQGDKPRLFSCVTCGILCFSCVAIIQPTDAAAHCLITADRSTFKHWDGTNDAFSPAVNWGENLHGSSSCSGWARKKRMQDGLIDIPVQSADQDRSLQDESGVISNVGAQKCTSSLGLLALTYGNSTDSEDEAEAAFLPEGGVEVGLNNVRAASYDKITHSDTEDMNEIPCEDVVATTYESGSTYHKPLGPHSEYKENATSTISNCSTKSFMHPKVPLDVGSNYSPLSCNVVTMGTTNSPPFESTTVSLSSRLDEDSSRMHIFCLQHAIQVQKRLRSIGGSNVLLLCHPDYPKVEAQAKAFAEELGSDYVWNDVSFHEASREDEETIRSALESEEALHGNRDWAVKLGVNLFYSANLSRSPLYCKQMPYNYIIYNAFGQSSEANTSGKAEFSAMGPCKTKRMVVAGKWCGRIWMSNQIHPYLAESDHEIEQGRNVSHMKTELKTERLSASMRAAETACGTCNVGKRRKTTPDNSRPIVKAKFPKSEAQGDSSVSHATLPRKSSTRTKRLTKEEAVPHIMISKSRKQVHSNPQDEPEPRDKCGRKNKQINSDIENEPEPIHYTRTRKHINIEETEDEPDPFIKSFRKKKRLKYNDENETDGEPSTRLRKTTSKSAKIQGSRSSESKAVLMKQQNNVKGKKGLTGCKNVKVKEEKAEFPCEIEGCTMSFDSKHELILHKKNVCPVKGCGKKFFSHKYLLQHRRVHVDERPLKCPWKGCKMTFKWAWARTEHIRVHTGARPYVCNEVGCGQTFRFVSDFSRHKRKTGHSPKKGR